MTGFPLQLPLLANKPRAFGVEQLFQGPVLQIELVTPQEVTAITDWLAGLRTDPTDATRRSFGNRHAPDLPANATLIGLNTATIRADRSNTIRTAARAATIILLALIIGAGIAMAQITIAALPDIIAQSAARNAW